MTDVFDTQIILTIPLSLMANFLDTLLGHEFNLLYNSMKWILFRQSVKMYESKREKARKAKTFFMLG